MSSVRAVRACERRVVWAVREAVRVVVWVVRAEREEVDGGWRERGARVLLR